MLVEFRDNAGFPCCTKLVGRTVTASRINLVLKKRIDGTLYTEQFFVIKGSEFPTDEYPFDKNREYNIHTTHFKF